jgi:hypothetical protein
VVERFDRPVPAQQVGQAGQLEGRLVITYTVTAPPPVDVQVACLAGDLDDLGGRREAEVAYADRFEGAPLAEICH